jgi:hypothetical protein
MSEVQGYLAHKKLFRTERSVLEVVFPKNVQPTVVRNSKSKNVPPTGTPLNVLTGGLVVRVPRP